MRASVFSAVLGSSVFASSYVLAGQAPGSATAPDMIAQSRPAVCDGGERVLLFSVPFSQYLFPTNLRL